MAAKQLFIRAARESPQLEDDSYFQFFKDSIGQGSGIFYPGIGEVYRSQSRYINKPNGFGRICRQQRGEGFGTILKSLWNMAFPMIKTGAKKIGSAALDVATNVAADALKGKDIKESAKEHLITKGTEILQALKKPLDEKKIEPPVEPPVSSEPAPVLKAPAPTFRRPQKRRSKQPSFPTKARSKQAKYPALKLMQ